MRHRNPLLLSLCLVGCGPASPAPSVATRTALQAEPEPLFLLPTRARCTTDTDLEVPIRVGAALTAPDRGFGARRLDPSSLLCGAARENELVARAMADGFGVPVRFTSPGDALVGFAVEGAAGTFQHAKCLLTVTSPGVEAANPGAFARRLGTAVEIVPVVDPTLLHGGDTIPLRVRSNQGGAANAEVILWTRGDAETGPAREALRTHADGDGTVTLPVQDNTWHLIAARLRANDGLRHVATLTFRTGGAR